jgi:hypothetical protein
MGPNRFCNSSESIITSPIYESLPQEILRKVSCSAVLIGTASAAYCLSGRSNIRDSAALVK